MYTYYVYLNITENRLIITSQKIIDKKYSQLMHSTGSISLDICKMFCIGYIMGSKFKTPINSIEEFK